MFGPAFNQARPATYPKKALPFPDFSVSLAKMSTGPTIDQLKRALRIAEEIAGLRAQLASIVQGGSPPKPSAAPAAPKAAKAPRARRRKLSPEALAGIRAGQQKRWAKHNAAKDATPAAPVAATAPAKPAKAKRTVSPEVRAKLAAAMKSRWAAAKQSGGPLPTAKKG